ncbi:MAG: phenazine biosynthesis protein PhzF family [Ilumatobacteraceae bacterium]|nr:phenazine biosynthesis protein PhzF family [Ilumatobacteraceae bacterium]
MQRPYAEVDVFTAVPYAGSPLAVVLDAEGLSTDAMQRFARWVNFSETAFLLPPTDPTADYRVRIFTTTTELPFAGHPTIGSCHAWLTLGAGRDLADGRHGGGRVVQECRVGLVTIERDEVGRLAFASPPLIRSGPLDDGTLADVVRVLGIAADAVVDAAWIDNGPGWLGILLGSAADVLAIEPADSTLKIGVIGPYPSGSVHAYEVRAFFPENGRTFEDPVTGSLNSSAAQWLTSTGRFTPPYTASQGTAIARAGVVHVRADDSGQLWIGGDAVTCVTGTVQL